MDKNRLILVVNTGSTTTKCSLFKQNGDAIEIETASVFEHSDDIIHKYPTISAQVDFREELVRKFVDGSLAENESVAAVGAIGGMLPPVPSGVIELNAELADFSLNRPVYQHASNLAAPIAHRLSLSLKSPSYVVDPVGVDEINPIARISGCPEFPRFSFVHALNIRATVRKLAKELDKEFNEMRCVVCHLGGGFSIAPLEGGKIIDSDNRMEGAPFTPERAGGIPPIPLLEACFSGKYTRDQLHKKLYGAGGIYAYLGTKDIREVVRRINDGDEFAKFIYDAMIYQICKEIGSMASVLDFDLNGIIVTGGVAKECYLTSEVTRKCSKLGRVYVYPGENENKAIATSVFLVLTGKDKSMKWPQCIIKNEDTDPMITFKKSNQ
ncbi:butyrate kinase [candidate division WOR-3 bacterium]|nr:butyrate kinase [candidate division WOR-3 bacterium]